MALNPGSTNHNWNYSRPDKEGYSTQLIGTVLAIQEVQKLAFTMNGQPGAPEFWPDGNPKMNIRLAVATPEGSLKTFTFQPASKAAREGRKKSVHMDLFHLTGDTDMMNLIGQTICITTQEGHYGQGNPRPWDVQLIDNPTPYVLNMPLPNEFKAPQVLANSAVSGGQVMVNAKQYQPQQPVQTNNMHPQAQRQPRGNNGYQPYMQHQSPIYSQQPAYPVQYQPQPYPQQYQPQQYQPQQPVQQPVQQQAPAYPEGMDPNVAQAMANQAFGGPVSVEVIPPEQTEPVGNGYVYDEDGEMPF